MIRFWFGCAALWTIACLAQAPRTIPISPPPDGGDAGAVLRDAVHRAIGSGPAATLQLDAGRYVVSSYSDENWSIVIGDADRLTIAGAGPDTEIIFRDPRRGGFLIAGGSGVVVRDLAIDYDPPPFTQGTITAVDPSAGTFDLQLDAGYPSPDEPWFATENPIHQMGVAIDAKLRQLKAGVSDFFFVGGWQRREAPGTQTWTIRLCDDERAKAGSLVPGDRFALLARRGNGAFLFAGSKGSTLENVHIYASPSLTVSLAGCSGMTLRGVRVTYRGGGDRLIASTGDGVHVQQNRVGPVIEKCLFEGLCDDAVNIYAPPMIVRNVVSPAQVEVTQSAHVRVGDVLQVFDPRGGMVRASPRATDVRDRDALRVITFDQEVPGIVAGEDHRTADTIYNLSASGAGYVIAGNHMRNHRRYGLLLRTGGGGVVVDNTFENLGGHGICIGNEPAWPEGPAGSDFLIRGNRFIGGGYCAGYGDAPVSAAIVVRGLSLGGIPEKSLLSNLRIEDNVFVQPPGAAIALRSARSVLLRNNITLTAAAEATEAQVVTEHVEDVSQERRSF